ncbi:MAG: prolyl oligopeptidase family serine peptidase [Verrucomicrobiota bacterium]|nr:prolyl oligopeptidase family serine peptidase [Verrucomicrobiota bacterium]
MSTPDHDPYQWLEQVEDEKALNWARALNAATIRELSSENNFEGLQARLLAALDSKERIPGVTLYGSALYNFWRDEEHPKGLWRRTTMEEYLRETPSWETLLDLDALSRAENENWVWKGATMRYPDFDRCLLRLSRGGADATVIREFDTQTKNFVPGGFQLPEAKSRVSWIDDNTVFVGTFFGPNTMTDSGYPRLIKVWKRNTPLNQAGLVFVGKNEDVSVGASVWHDHGYQHEVIQRADTFWTSEAFIKHAERWVKIEKPPGSEIGFFKNHLLLTLRQDWVINEKTYLAGSLLAVDLPSFLAGHRVLDVLFNPGPRRSLDGFSSTRDALIINVLDNVRNQLYKADKTAGSWTIEKLKSPGVGTLQARGLDPEHSSQYWVSVTDFLTPSSLYLGDTRKDTQVQVKSEPVFFETGNLKIQQLETRSRDNTRIPFFLVSKKDLKLDGNNPTLLYGYGGFEIPMLSRYRPLTGISWLEKGGVYVLANIRGGGEFGPAWHQSALKENRQRAYDDFIAIAESLIERNITSPRHLGIRGGSNGGLLMGNMMVQRPDLFKAIVCQVPLLDMKRYNKLLAGASWVGEYGNPDIPEEWSFLQKYSPYQLVKKGIRYPRTLFTTSTRDDRVHPGHARKMVAKMKEQGHDILYYENMEGGHGGASDNPQRAFVETLIHTFLWKELR